jgi:hypothetical protein
MDLSLKTTLWKARASRISLFERVDGHRIPPDTCFFPVFNRRPPDLTVLGQPITIAGKEAVPRRMRVVARQSGGAPYLPTRAVPP